MMSVKPANKSNLSCNPGFNHVEVYGMSLQADLYLYYKFFKRFVSLFCSFKPYVFAEKREQTHSYCVPYFTGFTCPIDRYFIMQFEFVFSVSTN